MSLLSLIPLPWKIGAAIGLVVALAGAYFGWAYHERSLGAAKVIAADQKAIDQRAAKDKVLSDKDLLKLKAATGAIDSVAEPAKDKIATDTPEQADKDAACAIRKMGGLPCAP